MPAGPRFLSDIRDAHGQPPRRLTEAPLFHTGWPWPWHHRAQVGRRLSTSPSSASRPRLREPTTSTRGPELFALLAFDVTVVGQCATYVQSREALDACPRQQ